MEGVFEWVYMESLHGWLEKLMKMNCMAVQMVGGAVACIEFFGENLFSLYNKHNKGGFSCETLGDQG